MLTYRPVQARDYSAIVHLASQSFADYPLFKVPFAPYFETRLAYFQFIEKIHRIEIKAEMPRTQGIVAINDHKIVAAAFMNDSTQTAAGFWQYLTAGAITLLPDIWRYHLIRYLNVIDRTEVGLTTTVPNEKWELSLLMVAPEHQGQHIGSRMLQEAVIPTLQKQAVHQLQLITHTQNNCRFYEQNGLTLQNRQELHFQEGVVNSYELNLDLTNHPNNRSATVM